MELHDCSKADHHYLAPRVKKLEAQLSAALAENEELLAEIDAQIDLSDLHTLHVWQRRANKAEAENERMRNQIYSMMQEKSQWMADRDGEEERAEKAEAENERLQSELIETTAGLEKMRGNYCAAVMDMRVAQDKLATLRKRIAEAPRMYLAMQCQDDAYVYAEKPEWDEEYEEYRCSNWLYLGQMEVPGVEVNQCVEVALVKLEGG